MNSETTWKGLVPIMFEFLITLVVLVGGGLLVFTGKGVEIAVSAITAVITFWFSRRQSENMLQQTQQATLDQVKTVADMTATANGSTENPNKIA